MKITNWKWWFGFQPTFDDEPTKKYSIAVVIPAYNEQESIASTIGSIKDQLVAIDEIIVVDDCSNDRTGEIAKFMGATVIRTPFNQGTKAQAQNYALKSISSDLVVTIDADTILEPNAIQRTLKYFQDPKTASVCGFVVPQKITTIWERGRFIEYLFGITIFKAAQDHVGAVMVSSGCFSVFRSDLLKQFGGFKGRTMAEDMDLTWEFHLKGYRIYLAPDAYCFPIDPPTFKIYVNQCVRWYSAFFQNITIWWKPLLKDRLGAFIFFYLFDAILSPFIVLGIMYKITNSLFYMLLYSTVVELIIISVPCLLKGYRIGLFWKTLTSIPSNFIIRPVNMYIFFKSLWNEWLFGKRLTTWDKGH